MGIDVRLTVGIVVSMARDLDDLHETEFENLTYDLVRARGMQNLVWRTPGADGGRDLEGTIDEGDFSGRSVARRWYIECKRYRTSISWPVVWEKISYSDAAHADYLLVVTNSKFSTRCVDEVEKWNAKNRYPQVRLWPRHDVLVRLSQNLDISAKYDLINKATSKFGVMQGLAEHVGKMVIAASSLESTPTAENRYLQSASALSRLMVARTADLVDFGKISIHSASLAPPRYEWLDIEPKVVLTDIDGPSLDAAVCLGAVLSRNQRINLSQEDKIIKIYSLEPWSNISRSADKLWNEIATWCNAEIKVGQSGAEILYR